MKRNLYIDFDGVIFDTITFAFLEMEKLKIDIKDNEMITDYFKKVNWYYLIEMGGIINDSLKKIETLNNSLEFDLVCVLTHRCSYQEGVIKEANLMEAIPNLKVITVPKKIAKHHAVLARNNILIDDDLKKILGWIEDGGIGILFNQKVNTLIYPYELNQEQPYFITNDLLDILKVNEELKEKHYVKRKKA